MNGTMVARVAALAILSIALLAGCEDHEKQLRSDLASYTPLFAKCKTSTSPAKARTCYKIMSVMLQKTVRASGVNEATRKAMLEQWLKKEGLEKHYAPHKPQNAAASTNRAGGRRS